MPLVLVCGLPCSGKTTRARALQAEFEALGKSVVLVNEESIGVDKAQGYRGSYAEKQTRAALKQHVERHINAQQVVICDSLNYIKGFRYELWCLARTAETTYCVVYCQCATETAAAFNAANPVFQWPEPLFSDLCVRFEAPLGNTKWDRPLFLYKPDADLAGAALPRAPLLVPPTCTPAEGQLPYAPTPAPTFPSWNPLCPAPAAADPAPPPSPPPPSLPPADQPAVVVSPSPSEEPPVSTAPPPPRATFVRRGRKEAPLTPAPTPAPATTPALVAPASPPAPLPLPAPVTDAPLPEGPPNGTDLPDEDEFEEAPVPLLSDSDEEEAVSLAQLASAGAADDANPYLYITSQHSGAALLQKQRRDAVVNAPYATVCEHLLTAKRFQQHASTRKPRLAESNFMQGVTRACQDIIEWLVAQRATYLAGEAVTVPHATQPLTMPGNEALLTLAKLRQLRMQFLRVAQMHPPRDNETGANMFVAFLNSAFDRT